MVLFNILKYVLSQNCNNVGQIVFLFVDLVRYLLGNLCVLFKSCFHIVIKITNEVLLHFLMIKVCC